MVKIEIKQTEIIKIENSEHIVFKTYIEYLNN